MELKQIQDLIKFVAKSGVEEVELEKGNFKITIRTKASSDSNNQQVFYAQPNMMPQQMMHQTQHAAPTVAASSAAAETKTTEASGAVKALEIKAPMIGTFYRSSGPDKEPFVKVGDRVEKGQVVCIIEAMKLFNEIEADISGTIVKVLADDSSPVEYDQPLFVVEP